MSNHYILWTWSLEIGDADDNIQLISTTDTSDCTAIHLKAPKPCAIVYSGEYHAKPSIVCALYIRNTPIVSHFYRQSPMYIYRIALSATPATTVRRVFHLFDPFDKDTVVWFKRWFWVKQSNSVRNTHAYIDYKIAKHISGLKKFIWFFCFFVQWITKTKRI